MSMSRRDSNHSSSSSQHSTKQVVAAHVTRTAAQTPQLTSKHDFDRHVLLYTGPDGVRHHDLKRLNDEYTGIGEQSSEKTGSLGYMFRIPHNCPFPRGKHGRLGEIGGAVELLNITRNDKTS